MLRKLGYIIFCSLFTLTLTGCTNANKVHELKSPCASASINIDSLPTPCIKRPANIIVV